MNRFEIDIDEIVVSGVPVSDVDAFGGALRARLGELAADPPATWRAGDVPVLTMPHVPAGDGAFGSAVADSVWRGLTDGAGHADGGAP